jgi:hypothetical protein
MDNHGSTALMFCYRIGHHAGTFEKDAVYSGGNSEVLSRLMGARGRYKNYIEHKYKYNTKIPRAKFVSCSGIGRSRSDQIWKQRCGSGLFIPDPG